MVEPVPVHCFSITFLTFMLMGGVPLLPSAWVGLLYLSFVVRKPVFRVSDLIRHKPGCAVTEDGERLEISDLESRGIVVSV